VREGVVLFRASTTLCTDYSRRASETAAYEAIKRILNLFVTDLMEETGRQWRAGRWQIGRRWSGRNSPRTSRLVTLSEEMESARASVKTFLYANLYNSPGMEEAHAYATEIVRGLFSALIADPGLLPEDHSGRFPPRAGAHRRRLHRRHDRQLHRTGVAALRRGVSR